MSSPNFGHERARRFQRALEAYPRARTTELLPLLAAARPARLGAGTAVELGSGSGYLTRLLQEMYATVYAVEKSAQMLERLPDGAVAVQVDGLVTGVAELPPGVRPDLVVSLATFHHIVERHAETGKVDDEASRVLQENSVAAWVDRLAEGGRFVLVDVGRRDDLDDTRAYLTRAAERLSAADGPSMAAADVEALDKALPDYGLRATLDVLGHPDGDLSLAGLARAYADAGYPLTTNGPITHFDETVRTHSIEGHDAYFWSAGDLAAGLARAGLSDVTVTTLPTPWLFLDKLGAYWFINELFGLDLDPEERRTGQSGTAIIDRNLTIRSDADHAIVDWQLLYATGVKRGRRGRSETSDSPPA